ncbi:MBOAT-domain-containing protein [Panus rudis PR-1116 ss-1]|nr:MBOAT-domain-containing protein [Panus rudis PR-1116 ss-1]
MDAIFVPLASATGASLDQIKLITCLLVSYPLGSVFIRIPKERHDLKHLFNISVAFFYLMPMLNLWTGTLQLLGSALGTYFLSQQIKGPSMPWIVFAFVMGHLTFNHLIRAIYGLSYETFEITGPQMVMTMKLTTFAWNVWDGRRPADELDKWQKEKRVVQHPPILAFLGYVFYFPGILVGPSLEFADYMKLVDGSLFKSIDQSDAKSDHSKAGRIIPKGRKRVAYRKMVMGLIYLGIFVVYGGSYTFIASVEDWFARLNILQRIVIYQFFGVIERTKYYAIWTLTEGASILTGFGFTGYGPSGESRWEGAANIQVWNIEFPPNVKVLLDSWNMRTNVWLRECIYKRVTPKGKKPGFRSSLITFMTSAFWHGFAGGYYLAFATGAFAQTVGRLCRTYIRPLFLPASYVAARGAPPPPQTFLKRAYDVIGIVNTLIVLNYMAGPFMLSTIENCLITWSRLWWYGHFLLGGALVFFYCGGIRMLRRIQAQRVKQAGGIPKAAVDGQIAGTGSGSATPSMSKMAAPLDDLARELESRVEN